jgi:FMN phosphatase YigB (HAD superfamily)
MHAMSNPEAAKVNEAELVFLIDVDNTLLDNDRIQTDIREHLASTYGSACRDRYAAILEQLWQELGYRDYLGALQRYRVEHVQDVELLAMSSFLIDYPFAERLYPQALQAVAHLRRAAPVVVLSDGDVVFQPRKVQRSGIAQAVDGRVLIYIHKELALDEVQRRHPARHYVLIDDKLRILSAVKQRWQQRVSTVFVRQGSYAHDAVAIAGLPAADHGIDHIADLLAHDVRELASTPRGR